MRGQLQNVRTRPSVPAPDDPTGKRRVRIHPARAGSRRAGRNASNRYFAALLVKLAREGLL